MQYKTTVYYCMNMSLPHQCPPYVCKICTCYQKSSHACSYLSVCTSGMLFRIYGIHTCSHMFSQRCRISEVHLGSAIQLLRVKMSCPDLRTTSGFLQQDLCQLAFEQQVDNGINWKA